jgi:hypothetical protein
MTQMLGRQIPRLDERAVMLPFFQGLAKAPSPELVKVA